MFTYNKTWNDENGLVTFEVSINAPFPEGNIFRDARRITFEDMNMQYLVGDEWTDYNNPVRAAERVESYFITMNYAKDVDLAHRLVEYLREFEDRDSLLRLLDEQDKDIQEMNYMNVRMNTRHKQIVYLATKLADGTLHHEH